MAEPPAWTALAFVPPVVTVTLFCTSAATGGSPSVSQPGILVLSLRVVSALVVVAAIDLAPLFVVVLAEVLSTALRLFAEMLHALAVFHLMLVLA